MIDPVESQEATLADLAVIARSWPTGPRAQRHRGRIVERHLPYVYKLAARYARLYHLPVADLIQVGALALYRAIDLYDVGQGTRFMSYADRWLRARMVEAARRAVSPVTRGTGTQWRGHYAVPEGDVALAATPYDVDRAIDLRRVLARLRRRSPRLADVLEWHYLEDLDCVEIGERLGGTSRQNAHQTLAKAERAARQLVGRGDRDAA